MFELILLEDDTDTVTLNVHIQDEFEDPVEEAYFALHGFGAQFLTPTETCPLHSFLATMNTPRIKQVLRNLMVQSP